MYFRGEQFKYQNFGKLKKNFYNQTVRVKCDLNGESPMKVKVKVAQLCPTLCDSMDYTVHGILQARVLEWVAFPFSRESSWPRN